MYNIIQVQLPQSPSPRRVGPRGGRPWLRSLLDRLGLVFCSVQLARRHAHSSFAANRGFIRLPLCMKTLMDLQEAREIRQKI